MGEIRTKGRSAYRDFNTDGVPSSGAYKPPKRDLRELFDIIDAAVAAFAELEAIGPISVIKPGLSALNSDLAHGNGTLAAVITTNEDAAGIYEKSGSSGSGSWTLRMLFTTVTSTEFAAIVEDVAGALADIEALQSGKASASSVTTLQGRAAALEGRSNYVATSISGTPDALVITTGFGIATLFPGMRVSFRATPGPNTSSTVTLDVDDTDPQPLKRGNGSNPRPGDLLGKQWQQTAEWTGNNWRLISSSQAVEVAEQVGTRDDDGVAITDAADIVSVEVDPQGALAAPAILSRQVAGVRTGFLRRQHLSAVAHLPLVLANLVLGQSNGLSNKAAVLSTRRSGRNMRMFNAGVRAFAGGGTPSENRETLVPHVEAFVAGVDPTPDRGETSCFGSAETFCDLIETEQGWEDYASTVMVISAASGEGSTTTAELLAEEVLDRFLLDVQAAAAFAQSEFGVKVKIPALFWNQGEGNVNAGTPPADWKNEKIAAQSTVETALNAITGQSDTIPFIFPQIASWNYYGKTPALAIAAAELAAANDKFLLLPSYMLTFPDGVHYTAADHHGIVGPRVGMLMKRLAINGQARSAFAPTRPVSNDREGKFARFAFKTWGDDDLTVDTRLVTKVVNHGIEMFQADGTTPVAIDRVWVHPREIIVKCASNPSAGMKYRYACAGSGSGRASGPRGNIRSTFGDQVQARTMQGVKPVHDWAAACEYPLT
jgi:hypothetical protein